MTLPNLLIFASGSADGGGSGFEKLVEASRSGILNAEIVGVVSNHENGGVREKADRLGIPFMHFPKPWAAENYQKIAEESKADFFALSGWLKPIFGLDLATTFSPRTVFNIHPGPLPEFGGKGFYGRHVHEAVIAAYKRGEVKYSQVCMHFVTSSYDDGPVFFRLKVKIRDSDTPEALALRVNRYEHNFQARITDLVVNQKITWDGQNPDSLKTPDWFSFDW